MSRLKGDEERAWQSFLHAHREIMLKLDVDLRESHRLTFNEYDVLLRLARASDGLSMLDLAGRVMLSPSGLTRLLDRLALRGLVDRSPKRPDARNVVATLTPEGRTLLRAAARTHIRGIQQHFIERLSPTQIGELADALEAVSGPHAEH